MKCRNCGAVLQIDDEQCRYCGKVNPRFKKQRETKKDYSKNYIETRDEVIEEAKRQSSKHVKIIAIFALVLVNVVLLMLNGNLWNIRSWMIEVDVNNNSSVHTAKIDEYLADENFLDLYYYTAENELRIGADTLDKYYKLFLVNAYYYYVYDNIMDYTLDENGYYDVGETSLRISERLDNVYEYSVQHEYDDPDRFLPEYVSAMAGMKQELHTLLSVYANLEMEIINTFPELSIEERASIIEEGFNNEE